MTFISTRNVMLVAAVAVAACVRGGRAAAAPASLKFFAIADWGGNSNYNDGYTTQAQVRSHHAHLCVCML